MKKILFLCACVLAGGLSSCGGDSVERVNAVIVNRVDTAVELAEKVTGFVQDDEYDQALLYVDSVSLHVTKSIADIEKLDNKSATEFKQAALDLLNLIATEGIPIYTRVIALYVAFEETDDEAQADEAQTLFNDFIDKAQASQGKVEKAQVAFAKANNMQLR
jgi:hypothetical protein